MTQISLDNINVSSLAPIKSYNPRNLLTKRLVKKKMKKDKLSPKEMIGSSKGITASITS